MNFSSMWGASLLLLVSLQCQGMAEPPVTLEEQWQKPLSHMQSLQQQWQEAKTPEARQQLQLEHWQSVQFGLQRVVACDRAWPELPGTGIQGGAMLGKPFLPQMAADSLTQTEMQIRLLELLLDQLDAHREMLLQP